MLAHRGLPGPGRPENSVAALAAAFDSGADGVEVDLRLTADGVLAVCHDPGLARLTGLRMKVAGSTWSVLHEAAQRRGVHLARLEDVLAVVAGRRVILELKKPPAADARTALAVADQLRLQQRTQVPMDVTISSFSPALLTDVRDLLHPSSGVRTALLGRPRDHAASVLRRALDSGHDEMHPHLLSLLASEGVVATAHACGLAVVPWTVNRRRDVRRLERLGVDALITDVPVPARAAVNARLSRPTTWAAARVPQPARIA